MPTQQYYNTWMHANHMIIYSRFSSLFLENHAKFLAGGGHDTYLRCMRELADNFQLVEPAVQQRMAQVRARVCVHARVRKCVQ